MGWNQQQPSADDGDPQWRAVGDIKGPRGDKGDKGDPGDPGDPNALDLTDLVSLYQAVLN